MKSLIYTLFICLSFTSIYGHSDKINKDTTVNHLVIDSSIQLTDNAFLQCLDQHISDLQASFFYGSDITYDSIEEFKSAEEYFPIYDSVVSKKLYDLDQLTPFDLSYNNRVKAFINLYANKRRTLTSKVLGLQEYYFPLIEEILDKYDMPYELKYLAVVESALNPTAKSRAGAKGLWQFMYTTGKIYDLKVNSYIDERFDPYLSTEAACKFLTYLHNYYDDWNLALAAYNCGPGNVNKAIRRSGGKRNYWSIYPFLPRETRGYVPAFIAVNYVMNHAEDFDISPRKPSTHHFENDTVHIAQRMSFKHLASKLDISIEELQFLNPIYKLGVVPNDGKVHVIKLPKDKLGIYVSNETVIKSSYKAPKDNSKELLSAQEQMEVYRVRSGDYLGKIAARYGCSVRQLKEWNSLRSNNLRIGQRLTIYTTGSRPKTTVAKKPIKTITSGNVEYYTVRKGDTLWDIARAKGITTSQIKSMNRSLNERRLKPGDKIIVGKKG